MYRATFANTSFLAVGGATQGASCDPKLVGKNGSGCSPGCFCDPRAQGGDGVCIDDSSVGAACAKDTDCPTGFTCDAYYIGGYNSAGSGKGKCSSSGKCTSTWGLTKRNVFGLLGEESRVGRMYIRSPAPERESRLEKVAN